MKVDRKFFTFMEWNNVPKMSGREEENGRKAETCHWSSKHERKIITVANEQYVSRSLFAVSITIISIFNLLSYYLKKRREENFVTLRLPFVFAGTQTLRFEITLLAQMKRFHLIREKTHKRKEKTFSCFIGVISFIMTLRIYGHIFDGSEWKWKWSPYSYEFSLKLHYVASRNLFLALFPPFSSFSFFWSSKLIYWSMAVNLGKA